MYNGIESVNTTKMVKIIYILNFVGVLLPFCALIGVVLAYPFQQDARGYLKSHFQYLIRTFWISILYYLVAGILCLLVIGYVLLFLVTVWWIIRNAVGLKKALHEQEITHVEAWWF